MTKLAIPLFHISSAAEVEKFYCDLLGFQRQFAQRLNTEPDPCYIGVSRDGVWLHLSSFSGDGVAAGGVNLLVEDVDVLHAEFVAKGVRSAVEPVDQTWGTRKMYVKDADGNCVRFMAAR